MKLLAILLWLCLLLVMGSDSPCAAPSRITVVGDESYVPMEFLGADGKARGISVDIWVLWSEKTGIEVDYRLMKWADALQAVQEGKADVISGMFYSDERNRHYDFSVPYMTVTTHIFYHKTVYGMEGVDDLARFKVGVVKGDYAEEYLRIRAPGVMMAAFDTYEDLVRSAAEGEVRVFICDTPVAQYHLARFDSNRDFKYNPRPIFTNRLFAAVRKGNAEMLGILDEGFEALSADEVRAVQDRWMEGQSGSRLPWDWLVLCAVLTVLSLGAVALWNLQLRRKIAIATRAARESEMRFKSLAENSSDSILRIDRDCRYLYANPTVKAMTGIVDQEFIGKLPRELGFPDDLIQLWGYAIRQVFATGERFWQEFQMPSSLWIDAHLIPEKDAEGRIQTILVYARDITERKLTEQALWESQVRYRDLVETIEDWIWEVNYECVYTYVSPRAREILGYEPEELLGKTPFAIMPPEEAEKIAEAFWKLHSECKPIVSLENVCIRKDGSLVTVETSGKPFFDKEGRLLGYRGVDRNVSERKQAERALRESEEKYRHLVSNAEDAIFIVQDGVIKFPNPATCLYTGYSVEELEQLYVGDLIHPEDRSMVLDRYRRRIAGEQMEHAYSFRTVCKNGDILWIQASGVLISWDGRPATLNFVRDITHQKKLEAQLQQAQKMEAIGTLAGGIAHDFNNLLMAIQGNVSLMLMQLEPSHPHYARLKNIEMCVTSGADLTGQLLGFARGGKYEVRPADPNELIERTSEMFARTRKEIRIHSNLREDVGSIEVDRAQIEQVLLNLYVNAWQAMPNGGDLYIETGSVSLGEEEARLREVVPGQFVTITVTDTGVGMDETVRQRIFEPFFTTKEMGRGTGLGLASAYGIVRNHGGFIQVQSQAGQGATFVIHIPASSKKTIRERKHSESVMGGTGAILLVDDEEIVLSVGKEMLFSLGYSVLTAASGSEALDAYEKGRGRIDMVILDMVMPDMSGRTTFEKLKQVDPGVRVLLSSGYSLDGEAEEILRGGCMGFIQKPFNIHMLSQRIREALGGLRDA